jgi:hypothetical protein
MWVLNRDKGLYGENAEEWRPERWLEYSPEKLKYLGISLFAFHNEDMLINCVQRLTIWDLALRPVHVLGNVSMKSPLSPFLRSK